MSVACTCAMPGCKNDIRNTKLKSVSFHNFPKRRNNIKKEWIRACKNPNINPRLSYVCSEHFLPEDFGEGSPSDFYKSKGPNYARGRQLIATAFPSQNMPYSPNDPNTPAGIRRRRRLLKKLEEEDKLAREKASSCLNVHVQPRKSSAKTMSASKRFPTIKIKQPSSSVEYFLEGDVLIKSLEEEMKSSAISKVHILDQQCKNFSKSAPGVHISEQLKNLFTLSMQRNQTEKLQCESAKINDIAQNVSNSDLDVSVSDHLENVSQLPVNPNPIEDIVQQGESETNKSESVSQLVSAEHNLSSDEVESVVEIDNNLEPTNLRKLTYQKLKLLVDYIDENEDLDVSTLLLINTEMDRLSTFLVSNMAKLNSTTDPDFQTEDSDNSFTSSLYNCSLDDVASFKPGIKRSYKVEGIVYLD